MEFADKIQSLVVLAQDDRGINDVNYQVSLLAGTKFLEAHRQELKEQFRNILLVLPGRVVLANRYLTVAVSG